MKFNFERRQFILNVQKNIVMNEEIQDAFSQKDEKRRLDLLSKIKISLGFYFFRDARGELFCSINSDLESVAKFLRDYKKSSFNFSDMKEFYEHKAEPVKNLSKIFSRQEEAFILLKILFEKEKIDLMLYGIEKDGWIRRIFSDEERAKKKLKDREKVVPVHFEQRFDDGPMLEKMLIKDFVNFDLLEKMTDPQFRHAFNQDPNSFYGDLNVENPRSLGISTGPTELREPRSISRIIEENERAMRDFTRNEMERIRRDQERSRQDLLDGQECRREAYLARLERQRRRAGGPWQRFSIGSMSSDGGAFFSEETTPEGRGTANPPIPPGMTSTGGEAAQSS